VTDDRKIYRECPTSAVNRLGTQRSEKLFQIRRRFNLAEYFLGVRQSTGHIESGGFVGVAGLFQKPAGGGFRRCEVCNAFERSADDPGTSRSLLIGPCWTGLRSRPCRPAICC
jgi:hypothetical protein